MAVALVGPRLPAPELEREVGGSEVFVDMPEGNPHARALRTFRSAETVFETARMYLNGRPSEDLQALYGVTTLELG